VTTATSIDAVKEAADGEIVAEDVVTATSAPAATKAPDTTTGAPASTGGVTTKAFDESVSQAVPSSGRIALAVLLASVVAVVLQW